ncbi:hypothetical protein N8T08_000587 [Aspergillus melleus]|uniref:Uncharacterized protein n=1 Tax=Aspergillus melleus TaxID=138277 RepID=A0ACC3AQA2_9EURO|nr:hypothetical protein N8T08_000587 [Aspergillus melleus]
MRQPEMTHSPAYYQEHGHLMTTSLHDPSTTPAVPPAAHHPSVSSPSDPPRSKQGAAVYPPSELNSVEDTSPNAFPSDSWDASYLHQYPQEPHQLPRHYQQQQAPGESIYPDPEPPVVAPVSVPPSRRENGSASTPASYSNGASRKEDRTRGSWTDHSSSMSGDNHHHSAPRIHKRPIHEEEPLADDSQDALLMLFRLSLPVPIFSLCASLYTVFGLFFVLFTAPFRLCSCIPYLRSTSFRAQLCDLLVPQLHLHERLACLRKSSFRSASTQSIYNNDPDRPSASNPCEPYSVGGLVAVLLVSSFLSLAFFLLVWTAAFFWVFAMVLGNPDGTERKDDGRAAVLGVARWWHIWLGKARKSPR